MLEPLNRRLLNLTLTISCNALFALNSRASLCRSHPNRQRSGRVAEFFGYFSQELSNNTPPASTGSSAPVFGVMSPRRPPRH